MTRPLRTILVVLATGAFVLAGCGSDGGDDDACAAGDAASTAAGEDFEAALAALGEATQAQDDAAYATALDDAETAVEDIIAALEAFDATVAELEVPTDLAQPVNDYLEALGTQLALAEQLRLAIVADDGEAFNEAGDQIQQADAATEPVRTEAAETIGAPECVPDGDDAATTDTTTTK